MKSLTLPIIASILALAAAQPLEKRVLVIETVTDVVVKTVDITTTVWVNPSVPTHAKLVPGHAHHANKHTHPKAKPAPVPAPEAQPPSQPEVAALPKVDQQPKAVPAPAPATPPVQQSPPAQDQSAIEHQKEQEQLQELQKQRQKEMEQLQKQHEQEQKQKEDGQGEQQQQQQQPQQPPVIPQPLKAAAPQPAAPAQQASPPTPQTPNNPAPQTNTGSGDTGNCGKVGEPCSGDITFYDTGLGACGWTNDGTTENVFALAHGMMGAQSNGNPFCGRQAEVTLNGKTVVGKLVDKCGGCEGQDIDLSHSMFQALADEGKGRIEGVKWHFID
ncbi:MAG: hypothetical protein Q9174_000816 [Haloplaca sp. 1 TL-2023]